MDMVAGHFGQLEFLTCSEMAFPFAREAAALANATARKMRESLSAGDDKVPDVSAVPAEMDTEPDIAFSNDVSVPYTSRGFVMFGRTANVGRCVLAASAGYGGP